MSSWYQTRDLLKFFFPSQTFFLLCPMQARRQVEKRQLWNEALRAKTIFFINDDCWRLFVEVKGTWNFSVRRPNEWTTTEKKVRSGCQGHFWVRSRAINETWVGVAMNYFIRFILELEECEKWSFDSIATQQKITTSKFATFCDKFHFRLLWN